MKGSAQGPQKKSKSIRKPVFSRRNLDFQLRKATQTHQNPVENPTPPWDAPRRAPDPPRVLPGHPRTSRSAKKIREPVGNQFFGARIEFSGSETLPKPRGTTRKPSLTVGRAGEGPRTRLGASLAPPSVRECKENPGAGRGVLFGDRGPPFRHLETLLKRTRASWNEPPVSPPPLGGAPNRPLPKCPRVPKKNNRNWSGSTPRGTSVERTHLRKTLPGVLPTHRAH